MESEYLELVTQADSESTLNREKLINYILLIRLLQLIIPLLYSYVQRRMNDQFIVYVF